MAKSIGFVIGPPSKREQHSFFRSLSPLALDESSHRIAVLYHRPKHHFVEEKQKPNDP